MSEPRYYKNVKKIWHGHTGTGMTISEFNDNDLPNLIEYSSSSDEDIYKRKFVEYLDAFVDGKEEIRKLKDRIKELETHLNHACLEKQQYKEAWEAAKERELLLTKELKK